jgi:hypothetical protein
MPHILVLLFTLLASACSQTETARTDKEIACTEEAKPRLPTLPSRASMTLF